MMLLDLDEAKKNPDWDIVFAGGVNAGDASAILWASPYPDANPYRLWLIKTKQWPKPEQTDEMRYGQLTEPAIFAWYQKHKGMDGRSQVWAVHDDYRFIRGLGDFWNADARHGAEFKAPTRNDSADHLTAKAGTIPHHYLLQCWHLMEVYDAQTWDFVSWRSADDFALIPVTRNTEYWLDVMVPAYRKFWQRVQDRSWPRPVGEAEQDSEEWQSAARSLAIGKVMERDGRAFIDEAMATLRRLATAKVTSGGGITAVWKTYRPRWQVTITLDRDMRRDIVEALAPLRGATGIKEIRTSASAPNLVLSVSQEKEHGGNDDGADTDA